MTLAMCVILGRWLWPLWRDLQNSHAATARVGDGDFGVRAKRRAQLAAAAHRRRPST